MSAATRNCAHASGECQSGPYCAYHGACRLRRIAALGPEPIVPASGREVLERRALALAPDEKRDDVVNRPSHYTRGSVECIEAIESALGSEFVAYCRGNILKYAWRTGQKDDAAQELRKAAWYASRAAQYIENGRDPQPAQPVLRKVA